MSSAPAEAVFPGVNGRIACGGLRGLDTDLEIFSVDPDGTQERLLTNNGFRDGSPAYSPDGSRIAFESQLDNVLGQPANTEIYVANNDGDLTGPDVRRITFNDGRLSNGTLSGLAATDFSPSWSPDGNQIVFHSGRETTFQIAPSPVSDFEIYRVNANTGETAANPAVRLTESRGQDAIPSWSPDGTKIAFQSLRTATPMRPVDLEVFTMNPDGTGQTNVTNSPGTPGSASANSNALDRDVIWSPNSQQLAISSTRGNLTPGNQNFDVYRMNRDGTNVVRLTNNPDAPAPGAFTDFDVPLSFSPDGTRLLFATSRNSTVATTNFFASTMSATAGESAGVQQVARVEQFQRCDWSSTFLTQPPSQPPTYYYPPPPPASGGCPAGTSAGVVCQVSGSGLLITGTAGNDTIVGSSGSDTIRCGDGDDVVLAGPGDDVIRCGDGNDTVGSGTGNDDADGEPGNDRVNGDAGRDRVAGGSGNDRLGGGSGNDRISGGSGNDRASGNSGGDAINGGAASDRLIGNSGNDRISGGGTGNDRLEGNSGNDRLSGGAGRDSLVAGTGRDSLSGGGGSDRLNTRDRRPRDSANCGESRRDRDRAAVDRGDRVRGCERVRRR